MILIRLRQGIGFDLEYNEDICHILVDEDDKEFVVAYVGIIIKIPFFTIYLGDFYE